MKNYSNEGECRDSVVAFSQFPQLKHSITPIQVWCNSLFSPRSVVRLWWIELGDLETVVRESNWWPRDETSKSSVSTIFATKVLTTDLGEKRELHHTHCVWCCVLTMETMRTQRRNHDKWLKTFQLIFHQCAFEKRKFQSHLLIVDFSDAAAENLEQCLDFAAVWLKFHFWSPVLQHCGNWGSPLEHAWIWHMQRSMNTKISHVVLTITDNLDCSFCCTLNRAVCTFISMAKPFTVNVWMFTLHWRADHQNCSFGCSFDVCFLILMVFICVTSNYLCIAAMCTLFSHVPEVLWQTIGSWHVPSHEPWHVWDLARTWLANVVWVWGELSLSPETMMWEAQTNHVWRDTNTTTTENSVDTS